MTIALSIQLLLAFTVFANPLVKPDDQYTSRFPIGRCTFTSIGESTFFILKPGYQMILEGLDEGVKTSCVHTVLDETESIDMPGIGEIEARVIEEMEWADGEMVETSKCFYAICQATGDVYSFGGEVWVPDIDGALSQESSWRAGQPDEDGVTEAGMYMPGTFLLGARYFREKADGVSMQRAENIAEGLTVTTAAGTFKGCVKVFESNRLEDDFGASNKTYAPGVGLVQDDSLKLVAHGYNIADTSKNPSPQTHVKTERISDERAKEIALAAVPGEVMDVAIERKLGEKRIVVEVIAAEDMAEVDVIIDMFTGEVLDIDR